MRSNAHVRISARVALAACGLMIAVGMTGCGNGMARLTGEVTLDGETLRAGDEIRGTIVFQPVMSGNPASGVLDEDGRYSVRTGSKKGLVPGDYVVSIRAIRMIPPKRKDGMPWAEKLADPMFESPRTSGLTVTVEPGSNEFDIAVTSPARVGRR